MNSGGSAITVNVAQPEVINGAVLTFSHPNTESGDSGDNAGVIVEHLQASMDDGKLKVSGYIKVDSITTSSELNINLNDLVTVN